jgi:hypothetical protein
VISCLYNCQGDEIDENVNSLSFQDSLSLDLNQINLKLEEISRNRFLWSSQTLQQAVDSMTVIADLSLINHVLFYHQIWSVKSLKPCYPHFNLLGIFFIRQMETTSSV